MKERCERSKSGGAEERRTYPEKERDKEPGGVGTHRAPPSLSLWLNADLLKRIVHRLANLPAASAAENSGANVMRVVALPAYLPAASSTIKLHRSYTNSFTPLRPHWPLSGQLIQGNQRFTHQKNEHPKRLFQNEMLCLLV